MWNAWNIHHHHGRDQYWPMINQAVKWAKAKVCVYVDSVLCVGQVKDVSGTTERGKGQVEDLKKYPSYQDAVGLDGEPIEFEWKTFPGFSSSSLLRKIRYDLETKNMDVSWSRIGREVARGFPRSKRTVELHRQQDGTAIQRDGPSCLQKYRCFVSRNLEAKERQMYHSFTSMEIFYKYRTLVPNSSICQSAQCLQSSCELVLPSRLDRRRKITSL